MSDPNPNSNHNSNIVMYTTRFCPYCTRARMLLKQKGVSFKEIPVDGDLHRRREMVEKSGRYTVPQIWIANEHIGGCDELYDLEREGELNGLLSRSAEPVK